MIRHLFPILASLCFFSACTSVPNSPVVESERVAIIQQARALVADSDLFSNEEIRFSQEVVPTLYLYEMAGDYTDYRIVWKLDNGDEIYLSGQGDARELDGVRIERKTDSQLEHSIIE